MGDGANDGCGGDVGFNGNGNDDGDGHGDGDGDGDFVIANPATNVTMNGTAAMVMVIERCYWRWWW